jgi:excisionase family DNA binding protein
MNSETSSSAPIAAVVDLTRPPLETLTYSVTETARVLGVSLPTVYRLIARRLLKPLPSLRHKRVSKRQVLAYSLAPSLTVGVPSGQRPHGRTS